MTKLVSQVKPPLIFCLFLTQCPLPTTPPTQKPAKPAKKKRKIRDASPDAALTEITKSTIKEIYQKSPEDFIIPVDNFLAFLENSHGNSNPYLEALKFTADIKSLLSNMYTIYPALKERSIKNRFTRLAKKIKAHLAAEEPEVENASSAISQSSADLSDEDLNSDASQQSQKSTY